jgi:hypothetical protein
MAKLVTLAKIKQRARVRADQENSNFVGDESGSSDLLDLINASASRYYDLLIEADPLYFEKTGTVTPDATTGVASLPSDFYKLLGVDLIVGNGPGNRVSLSAYEHSERNSYVGGNIGNNAIELSYAPAFVDLVNDTDTIDGYNGWDEFIVVDTAIKMLSKEESDISALLLERKEQVDRILAQARARNMASSGRWTDVNSMRSAWNCGVPSLKYILKSGTIKFVQIADLGGGF